ncbi:hypothetical protein U27_06284 [Candidatus Vecturithrix granuli]|uniref:Radical SAM domain protein n=1 Tax=Vecturithrix granuli TaxID=1499967 RepID=A0A081C402_VECG1|nr:hypothetical protein U27_06284 [Candidatus Vecturithrix granuli]
MKKGRKVLLLEPNYKNKYPPIGLMKLATYHRRLGDDVTFFKGDLQDFILEQTCIDCLQQLQYIENCIAWTEQQEFIKNFIRRKDLTLFDDIAFLASENKPLIKECLNYYRNNYILGKYKQEPRWDRICVTTLFTFYWTITIETIKFAQKMVRTPEELKVGGIMASLLSKEIKRATGVEPIRGLLDQPGILDANNQFIIDELPLDYSILDEIDYEYPTRDAYFTFMTKGCKRHCKFCSVPILEPTYKPKIDTIEKFNVVNALYGESTHLLLLDNNVLPSPRFTEIIQEIKQMGFYRGATFVEPNQLEIAIKNLKNSINDKAYVRRSYKLIHKLLKRLRGNAAQTYYNVLDKYALVKLETTTKEYLLAAYPEIQEIYEKNRPKTPRLRHVDFNQGVDCHYITEEKMKLISEISISPLRIAFDSLKVKDKYIKAVELAEKYGIKELSNYILYNYDDSPDDLYERLRINQELCDRLDIHIYSFPMKYIPVKGKFATNREYTAPLWNKKFIRCIQSIINVTQGIVAHGRVKEKGNFFEKAFGGTLEEFRELLYMPEVYIVYRKVFEVDLGYTPLWQELFRNLSKEELEEVKPIIESNNFKEYHGKIRNPKLLNLLKHYTISREEIKKVGKDYKKLKKRYDRLIKNDLVEDLSLFEVE